MPEALHAGSPSGDGGLRVCFLLNHYATHQVAHAAPFGFELSRREPQADVTIACTSDAQRDAASDLGRLFPGQRATIVRLQMSLAHRAADALLSRLVFVAKRGMLASNLEFFRGFDAIAAPEKTCLELRTRLGLAGVKFIHTRHGAGDREGSFDERTREFDLTLVAGQKILDRLAERDLVSEGKIAVVGYPKLDLADASPPPPALFANTCPTVVYNPHFDTKVSSWRSHGIAVLDWFAAHPDYNLMFAPHVVLFERARRHRAQLPHRMRASNNLRVDLGSAASSDMTYTRAADIYLGDVSSQVYEFIARPRPCVFLNAHAIRWEGDPHYAHWRFGPVIERVEQLGDALDSARRDSARYEAAQREAFAYTFSREPGRSAAQRGADAVAEFLRRGRIVSGCYAASPASSAR